MTLAEQLLQRGKREGMLEGKLRDKQEVLLQLLARKFGSVGKGERLKITAARDPNKLDRAIEGILSADTIADILSALD